MRPTFQRNALSVNGHRIRLANAQRQADADVAAFLGKFDGVVKQIGHHLVQPSRVAPDCIAAVAVHVTRSDALGRRCRRPSIDGRRDDAAKLDTLNGQPQLTRLDAADIQRVFDQLALDAEGSRELGDQGRGERRNRRPQRWKSDNKLGPMFWACTVYLSLCAMQLDEWLDQRQCDTKATLRPRTRASDRSA